MTQQIQGLFVSFFPYKPPERDQNPRFANSAAGFAGSWYCHTMASVYSYTDKETFRIGHVYNSSISQLILLC
jgi:hypothetical protein